MHYRPLSTCWIKARWTGKERGREGERRGSLRAGQGVESRKQICADFRLTFLVQRGGWIKALSQIPGPRSPQPSVLKECHSSWLTHHSDAGDNLREILAWCYEQVINNKGELNTVASLILRVGLITSTNPESSQTPSICGYLTGKQRMESQIIPK